MLLSIIVPCYNETRTLRACIERVVALQDERCRLEVIIVDDCSRDDSAAIAAQLATEHPCVRLVRHERNQGKGAAVRSGLRAATGDIVAIQDADLEYDPQELKRMTGPIVAGQADVVFGSRFLAGSTHRVLYFWHSVANRMLTLLSNMFSDLNLTDMECCYKLFTREVAEKLTIHEDRFGVEPELTAQVAAMRVRVYEMGISYAGRTYEEGKKIGLKDAFRALYCILRYNAGHAPAFLQFLVYCVIGGVAALVNLAVFLALHAVTGAPRSSAVIAFVLAAGVNLVLCTWLLFERRVKWSGTTELLLYALLVAVLAWLDAALTVRFLSWSFSPAHAKLLATAIGLVLNFAGRRYVVFPQRRSGEWRAAGP